MKMTFNDLFDPSVSKYSTLIVFTTSSFIFESFCFFEIQRFDPQFDIFNCFCVYIPFYQRLTLACFELNLQFSAVFVFVYHLTHEILDFFNETFHIFLSRTE